ncbi:MAG: carbohydrate ABC transporter permease [Actinomycetaceae bacterium]|nr:carbohydrate ABC transporter permease [Actinomycetaceae bacterium]
MNKTTTTGNILRFTGLALWMVITIFPFYWIVISSFKDPTVIAAFPVQYWPEEFTLVNYENILSNADFGQFLLNSFVIATIAGSISTAIAVLSGYVLARFHFRSKGAVIIAFLITQMIPAFIALGPLYVMMSNFNLNDSRLGLILVYITMCIPFSSIMLRGFFANIPDALEEAAMVDGCTRLSALLRIIVPTMIPGIASAFIFNFVNCWNELFLSVTLISADEKKTIPTALNGFITTFNIDWGPMCAAAVLTILPTMLLFAFASRYIINGLTAGAVKG